MHLAAGYVQNWTKESNNIWTNIPDHMQRRSLVASYNEQLKYLSINLGDDKAGDDG